jgi:hypothetical protein
MTKKKLENFTPAHLPMILQNLKNTGFELNEVTPTYVCATGSYDAWLNVSLPKNITFTVM